MSFLVFGNNNVISGQLRVLHNCLQHVMSRDAAVTESDRRLDDRQRSSRMPGGPDQLSR